MTQFKFPTILGDSLENEIRNKLIAQVECDVKRYNTMWAKREQEGKTFHTEQTWHGEEKVYYYKFSQFLDITFHQEETSYFDPSVTMRNDYYRPLSCKINLQACIDSASEQRKHSVALAEQRVNSHLAVTDQLDIPMKDDLKLGSHNLIEGCVTGFTNSSEDFQITLQMMWNYRYGENSANGYLTTYVQFRSNRYGARQEGKSVQQAITDADRQAKRDEKLAIQNEKQMAKWEKFQKLPVQMEKWLDKQIKEYASWISEEGLAESQAKADRMNYTFDKEWQIKSISTNIEEFNTLRNDCRHWQNDKTGLKALFDKGIDTRNKLKEMYGV
tara:strand:+ start:749 stop:1735 length:987 start_codon:yes stop_codon:yes gene_type:complete